MAINLLVSNPPQTKALAASTIYFNKQSPFLNGEPVYVDSLSGTTLYGAQHPGDASTTKYAAFKQTISGNKVFELPTAVTAPQNTSGGALSAANQLRVVAMVDEAPKFRARGDQVAPSGNFIIGAGGGTLVGDATMIVKGTTAANLLAGSVLLSLASTGANVKTIIAGDRFTIAGDTQVYTATGGGTLTVNGTTEVNVQIAPPIQIAQTANAVVTVLAASGKAVLFETAPALNAKVEVLVLDAADVVTVGNTAGALTAGQLYDATCPDFLHTAGAVNMSKAVSH